MRMVYMSAKARREYKNASLVAANHLWQFFHGYYDSIITCNWSKLKYLKSLLPNNKFPNLYANLVDKLNCYGNMLNGSKYYQYDEEITYVCSCIDLAKRYAYRSFAGGEMGLIVYLMIEACEAIGIDYKSNADSNTIDSISRVWEFSS